MYCGWKEIGLHFEEARPEIVECGYFPFRAHQPAGRTGHDGEGHRHLAEHTEEAHGRNDRRGCLVVLTDASLEKALDGGLST